MHKAAIGPGKSIAYKHKQSQFPQLGGVLPLRWIVAGPSGAGKGVTHAEHDSETLPRVFGESVHFLPNRSARQEHLGSYTKAPPGGPEY